MKWLVNFIHFKYIKASADQIKMVNIDEARFFLLTNLQSAILFKNHYTNNIFF